jgi:hypothetical protein
MADKIAIWLAWGTLISSIFPLLFFYKSWNNLKKKPFVFIAIYFVVKVFLNTLSAILYYASINLPFNITPFFTFNGNIFLMTFFLLSMYKYKKIISSLIIITFIFHLCLFYIFEKIGDFDIALVFTSIVYTILAILLLQQLSENAFKRSLVINASFWFCLAVLCSVVPGVITNLLGNLLKDFNNAFPFSILAVSNFLAIASNILYSIGVFRLAIPQSKHRFAYNTN